MTSKYQFFAEIAFLEQILSLSCHPNQAFSTIWSASFSQSKDFTSLYVCNEKLMKNIFYKTLFLQEMYLFQFQALFRKSLSSRTHWSQWLSTYQDRSAHHRIKIIIGLESLTSFMTSSNSSSVKSSSISFRISFKKKRQR